MTAGLTGLARDLQKWGRGLDRPAREWEYREYLASRAIALSLAIDMRRMARAATRNDKTGAGAVANRGQRRAWGGLRDSAWLVKARGPVHWWEWGTDAHYVVARGADTSKKAVRRRGRQERGTARGRDAQVLADGRSQVFGQYAYVSGMRRKPFWYRALDRYWPDAVKRAEPELDRALEQAVHGGI